MGKDEWNHDRCTVQNKMTINFSKVDRRKATVLMRSLKEYENVDISSILAQRQTVKTGKAVADFLNDGAAMTKRLFVRLTPERKRLAKERFGDTLETDKCYPRLRTMEDKAVLRFCYCSDTNCPINVLFAQFMMRTAGFIKEYNGYKGSRLVMADFFTTDEIIRFRQSYLQENGRPIRSVGQYAVGSYGDEDEVEGNAHAVHFR